MNKGGKPKMYAIILDFYWFGGQEPVTLIQTAETREELLSVSQVDPTTDDGNWPRAQVIPLDAIQVRNTATGGMLAAHICQRKAP
jgi:hypothetical protein